MHPVHRPRLTLAFTLALVSAACTDPGAEVTAASVEGTPAAASEQGGPTPLPGTEALPIGPENGRIEFVGAKVTASHEGGFRAFAGTITLDPEHLEASRVEVTIQTESLFIDNPRLENHLRSDDFFDVARFPTATFRSTGIAAGGADGATHTVTGDLTLHGQTQRISFPARLVVGPSQLQADAEFSIDRQQFGIAYRGAPDNLVRDLVVIRLHVVAPRGPR